MLHENPWQRWLICCREDFPSSILVSNQTQLCSFTKNLFNFKLKITQLASDKSLLLWNSLLKSCKTRISIQFETKSWKLVEKVAFHINFPAATSTFLPPSTFSVYKFSTVFTLIAVLQNLQIFFSPFFMLKGG